MNNISFRDNVKVSALVSTYNSEQFIQGCLDDLIEQSLYQQGLLEIIIIDCNSPSNEVTVCNSYQKKYERITYIRLSERESLYSAWNIGARMAVGDYLTNANTDDRHHFQALEHMYLGLVKNPNVDLAYADVYASKIPNQIFPQNDFSQRYSYKKYFAPDVITAYQFGCQPMWRRSLHDKIGWFSHTLKAAGDYEFNWRFALAGCKALHIAEPLGLFLERNESISRANSTSTDEQQMLRQKYINGENILKLYQLEGWPISSQAEQIAVFNDLLRRAKQLELPWHPGQHFQDLGVVDLCENILRVLQLNSQAMT